MRIAIDEARQSLREGNHGFGAVIIKGGEIVSRAHDEEESAQDPTSHAEINAVRKASKTLGKRLDGCAIVSTHEPCPMCSTAIVWAGLDEVAYGYSIADSLRQGRRRIDLSCAEVFDRAGASIYVRAGVLGGDCGTLYDKRVRDEVRKLRGMTEEGLGDLNAESTRKRLRWFEENGDSLDLVAGDAMLSAYSLLLRRLGISREEAPVVRREADRLVFHSMNSCPTLEACKILGLDTRQVCRLLNEGATDALVKRIDPRLRFARNYDRLRPYAEYCEEMIVRE